MKKLLLIATVALIGTFTGAPQASAQSPNFTYSNFSGNFMPGSSFNFDITLNFTAGGQLANVAGLSVWFYQVSPGGPPFNFATTLRALNMSLFTEGGPGPTYPQILDPINHPMNGGRSDLGAQVINPLPPGSYLFARVTMSIGAGTLPGSYTFGNTTAGVPGVGGRISVINDTSGNTAPIAASNFTIGVIPEPSTFALLVVAAIGLGATAYRRRAQSR